MWKLKIGEGGPWLKSNYNFAGRQVWEFDRELGTDEERAEVERVRAEYRRNNSHCRQNSDLLVRMQLRKENDCSTMEPQIKVKESEEITEETVVTTLRRAITYFSSIQAHDGHWPADFQGPLFLTTNLVIALYVTKALNTTLSPEHRKEIRRYLYNCQNEDGGWGFSTEGTSIMFSTALCYITLRLLGVEADGGEDGAMEKARRWILDHEGLIMIPTWGKIYLSILGVFEWSGVNPVPPELVLLPWCVPIHPGKLWSQFRFNYLPMAYFYGKRFVGTITDLVLSLREELYCCPYHMVDWNQARKLCAKEDGYVPHPIIQDIFLEGLYKIGEPLLMRWPLSSLREKALKIIMEWLHYEDECSVYLSIGGAQKVLWLLACWVEDPSSDTFKYHLARIPDYLWVAEDGMKLRACGSQLWDAAFAVQAIIATGLSEEYETTLVKANEFIKLSQITKNPSENFTCWYRHISKGGWGFAEADQGWPVSDCTAEALKAALLLQKVLLGIAGGPLATERAYDTINYLLSLQNKNGGFSTWELTRTYTWVEKLMNASNFFRDIVLEYQYVECTSSVLQALALFRKIYPGHRRKDIKKCMQKAMNFLEIKQQDDGSWYGTYAICYTYGTWFAVEGLVAGGKTYNTSSTIRRACAFLLSKQLTSGGWGESNLSSRNKVYTNLEGNRSHLVNTAWAMLALIKAGQADRDPAPLHRAARFIINMQLDNGDFPEQEMRGSFNRTGLLNYSSYINIFPIWALGEYRKVLLNSRRF